MTTWTFHSVEGLSVSDKWANEPDDAERIAQSLADTQGVVVVAVPHSERGETYRKAPFGNWTDSDLRAVCRRNDPNGDFDDCTRADLVAILAGWMAEEPDYWRARLGGAS